MTPVEAQLMAGFVPYYLSITRNNVEISVEGAARLTAYVVGRFGDTTRTETPPEAPQTPDIPTAPAISEPRNAAGQTLAEFLASAKMVEWASTGDIESAAAFASQLSQDFGVATP